MKYPRLMIETLRALRGLGLDPSVKNGGKHLHVHFTNAHGVACRLTFSHGTGSSSMRLARHVRTDLRRALEARAPIQGENNASR